MARSDWTDRGGDWTEHGAAWDDVAGDDRTTDDNPTILFVNDPDGGTSYDVDIS